MLIGIMYHGIDMDGYCSARIVSRYLTEKGYFLCEDPEESNPDINEYFYIPANYSWELSFNIQYCDKLYILDYTPDKKEWVTILHLLGLSDITWIDHHERNYKAAYTENPNLETIPGIRDNSEAAVGLTWSMLYDKKMPIGVQLINDYDIWRKDGDFDWDDAILPFQMSFRCAEYNPSAKGSAKNWALVDDEVFGDLESVYDLAFLIDKGKAILNYRELQFPKIAHCRAHEADFLGRKALAINSSEISSLIFKQEHFDNYDICIAYNRRRDGRWRLGLYSEKDHIHCGDLAASFKGGGGHKGAAGCIIDNKYWDIMFNNRED